MVATVNLIIECLTSTLGNASLLLDIKQEMAAVATTAAADCQTWSSESDQ